MDAKKIIYAHNGGRFDFTFLLDHIDPEPVIIGGRIVECTLHGHTLRDSYAIIPAPLKAHQKEVIDYQWFKRGVRHKHKDAIIKYLQSDCMHLHTLVAEFRTRYDAKKLTIASTAMAQLKQDHEVTRNGPQHDARFRPYFYGGRVQCFTSGMVSGDWKVYDVNSMYPFVMRDYPHPVGSEYRWSKSLKRARERSEVFFIRFVGASSGAMPQRTKTGLSFASGRGEFFACSHELLPALERGECVVDEVLEVWEPLRVQRFDNFVNRFMRLKIESEQAGDITGRLFAKLIQNSAYGKFAIDPMKFKDWHLWRHGALRPGPSWEYHSETPYGALYCRSAYDPRGYIDVAVSASITSAARATLARAIVASDRPVYCDTDSIIAEHLDMPLHPTDLGAWKTEAQGDLLALAGKKLYALYDKGEVVKWACKGVRITPAEICKVAQGEAVIWNAQVPGMGLHGLQKYVTREVRATVKG